MAKPRVEAPEWNESTSTNDPKKIAELNARNDGYKYDATTGSRTWVGYDDEDEPAPPPPPEPEHVSAGYPSSDHAAQDDPEPDPVVEPTPPEKRAEVTKPAAGLETTYSPDTPVRNVSYLTGNTAAKTTSRFLKKKKEDEKLSLFA